jgi:hypothetical protein
MLDGNGSNDFTMTTQANGYRVWYAQDTGCTFNTAVNVPLIMVVTYNGAYIKMYKDGASTDFTYNAANARMAVGTRFVGATLNMPCPVEVAEALVYRTALNRTQLNTLFLYLSKKYNIPVTEIPPA